MTAPIVRITGQLDFHHGLPAITLDVEGRRWPVYVRDLTPEELRALRPYLLQRVTIEIRAEAEG